MNNVPEEDRKFLSKVHNETFKVLFQNYCNFYKSWRLKVIPEEPTHPYDQFRQKHNDPEDISVMNTGRSS